MYLFDTDTITNLFKVKPSENLLAKLDGLSRKKQFISTITIGEIVYGALKSDKTGIHLDNLEKKILSELKVLSFDKKAAYVYGEIRADLEKKGEILDNIDMQIASIAIANNLTLITGNIKHFQRIDKLRFENWL